MNMHPTYIIAAGMVTILLLVMIVASVVGGG